MFDAMFYQAVLPDRVKAECENCPSEVPVVELHLGSGAVLDLCHILHASGEWMVCRFFRNPGHDDEMDVAFVPYGLVSLVTVSTHPPEKRRFGFQLESSVAPPPADPPAAAQAR